jgi:hypothetical protein
VGPLSLVTVPSSHVVQHTGFQVTEIIGPESRRLRYVFGHPRWDRIVRTGLLFHLMLRITEASPSLDIQAFGADVHLGLTIETHAMRPLQPEASRFIVALLDLLANTSAPERDVHV